MPYLMDPVVNMVIQCNVTVLADAPISYYFQALLEAVIVQPLLTTTLVCY
jgi:hypothetical protein